MQESEGNKFMNSKKIKSKEQNEEKIKQMEKYSFLLCILLCVSMLSGCNNIYRTLSDETEKMFQKASNDVADKPKEAILNALNVFNEMGGESAITDDMSLQGKRIIGSDSYVGGYSANYDNFSGTEITFGGTSVERKNGNTIEVSCSLAIDDGKAIIFLKSGDTDPVALLDNSDEYAGTIEVGNGSSYIGVWGDDFSGTVELNIK